MQIKQALHSGNLHILKPGRSLNKSFLEVNPNRTQIEGFKGNPIELLDRTNDNGSEEFHKNLIIDFLKKTYYKSQYFIKTVDAKIYQFGCRINGLSEGEIGIVERECRVGV